MMSTLPSRQEIIEVIKQLQTGTIKRSQVAKWAFTIIDDDEIRVTDQTSWKVIQGLGAVDLPASDHDYLYSFDDFDDWLNTLRS
ncbi:hypothetical protein MUA03_22370 [Enterobacteriaceae bacterium H16N7]|nr:hypothetical protein [Dryocola clanedunensis]